MGVFRDVALDQVVPRSIRLLVCSLLCLVTGAAHALPSGFIRNTVVNNLQAPVNVVTMPDGRLLIGEKAGRLKLYNPSTPGNGPTTILTITPVESQSERGLASMALAPNFANTGFLYVYYTRGAPSNRNRISRFRFVNGSINPGTEVLVWEDSSNFKSCCHFGGGLDFGPDGMLYLTTGEEFEGPQAQNLTESGGKIIRLDVSEVSPARPWVRGAVNDHIIPSDNPASIMDGPGGNLDEIWAYGLRNPFRAHWDIQGNRFFIGDVGGNVQSTAFEELNLGAAGADFGWPQCEGACTNAGVRGPVYSYGHQLATPIGGAIAAGVVYRGTQFPIQFQNRFFFADYSLGYVKYLHLNSNGQLTSVSDFDTNVGAPVAIEEGLDGTLYVVDYISGRLIEYKYVPENQPPSINFALASTLSGEAPLAVSFSASATDPDGDALTYSWSLGDGVPNRFGRNVSTTYNNDGVYSARLRVSDGVSDVLSEVIEIQVGSQPIVNILFPPDGMSFVAGDTIDFAGEVLNPTDGVNYDFDWTVDFVHNGHRHPGVRESSASGQFDIPRTGHDYLGQTGYELSLTVTGQSGLSSTAVVRVQPEKVDLNLTSSPAGIPLFVDGVQQGTPVAYDNIVGFEHALAAPETTCLNGTLYRFQNWSNGRGRIHSIVLPRNDVTLNARFTQVGACEDLPAQGLVAWYESDFGLQVNASSQVSRWRDRSSRGNDWNIVRGAPIKLDNVLSGQSVVSFNGVQDALVRNGALNGMPLGNADRTVLMLVRYNSPGSGGFAYGTPSFNRTFGLSVSPASRYRVNGFGRRNDFISNVNAVNGEWEIHDAVVNGNQIVQSVSGNIATVNAHTYRTSGTKMVLGADLDENPHVNMQIAALVVYDRALSASELQSTRAYLRDKYLAGAQGANQAPVAQDDSLFVQRGASAALNVLLNDVDPESELAASSISIVRAPRFGSIQNDGNGVLVYLHGGTAEGTDSFDYTVSDATGLVSNVATVSVNIESDGPTQSPVDPVLVRDGLVAHFNTDAGVLQSGAGVLNRWLDQSGLSNDLDIVRGGPRVVPGALNGYPAIDFNGSADSVSRDSALSGFSSGSSDRSMYLVVRYRGRGYGGVSYGSPAVNQTFGLGVSPSSKLMVQGWGAGVDKISNVDGAGAGWLIQSVVLDDDSAIHRINDVFIEQFVQNYNTTLDSFVVGSEIDGTPYVNMQVASILVYDRGLTFQQHEQTIAYLTEKYFGEGSGATPPAGNLAPVAVDDAVVVDAGSNTVINVLDNDFDPDGLLNIATIDVTRATVHGDVVENSDGSVSYQNLGEGQEMDSFRYRISDDQGAVSNAAEVRITVESAGQPSVPPTSATFPPDGLVLRLESDVGIQMNGQSITRWRDQSGNQNNLLAGSAGPTLASFANGQSYVSFDGVDDVLIRSQNIVRLPAADADRTMYSVVEYLSNGYGGIAYGTASTNNTYGHVVDPRGRLMVQAWGVNNDIQLPVNARNIGWAVQGSAVTGGEVMHYLDGDLIRTDAHQYDTLPQSIVMGAEIDETPYVRANVAAVFIYDRSLTVLEHSNLNQYLTDKYLR